MAYCPNCKQNVQILLPPQSVTAKINQHCSNCFYILDFPYATDSGAFERVEKRAFDEKKKIFIKRCEKTLDEYEDIKDYKSVFVYILKKNVIYLLPLSISVFGIYSSFPFSSNALFKLDYDKMSIYQFLASYGFLLYIWLCSLLMFIGGFIRLFNRLLIRRITLNSIFSAREWLEKKLLYVSNLEYSHLDYSFLKDYMDEYYTVTKKEIVSVPPFEYIEFEHFNYFNRHITIIAIGSIIILSILLESILSKPLGKIMATIAFFSFLFSLCCSLFFQLMTLGEYEEMRASTSKTPKKEDDDEDDSKEGLGIIRMLEKASVLGIFIGFFIGITSFVFAIAITFK